MAANLLIALALVSLNPQEAQDSPPAQTEAVETIEDYAWMAGRWTGPGLGGIVEEVWSPPIGGQMIGHFGMYRDGKPIFYELMMMDEAEPGSGVRLRVKHFNADFTAWEDKGDWHEFEPVGIVDGEARFNGIKFHREGDELHLVVMLKSPEGEITENPMVLTRAE